MTRITAGELSKKALSDTTKYNALEVGHGMTENIDKHLEECIENHLNIIDDEGKYPWRELKEFTVVYIIGKDNIHKNANIRKFYCCPFLPSPRPNQSVFLYTKSAGRITKRLWVLPCDMVMAELASLAIVHKRYKTMQAWSIAFFENKFYEYVRYDQKIDLLSQEEFISQHREELIQAGCKIANADYTDPFDFSKIHIKNVIDTQEAIIDENSFGRCG